MLSTNVDTLPKHRYSSLDGLRGVAVLMVVYDHLFAIAGERMNGGPFPPVSMVRQFLLEPLGIIQDFGWLGVCIFFLISGFVIAKSASEEAVSTFAIRRIFRIFPPLCVAILLAALIDLANGEQKALLDYVIGITLVGYFIVPQVIILGVAWTLAIEIIFYILMAAISPILKSKFPLVGLGILIVLTILCTRIAGHFGDSFFLFAATVAYIPILLIGSLIYFAVARNHNLMLILLLIGFSYASFLFGLNIIHTKFLPTGNSYPISVVYAIAIFIVCLNTKPPAQLSFFGDISYSLYLVHGLIGFFVLKMALLNGLGGFSPYLAVFASIVTAVFMYNTIEKTAMSMGKKLSLKYSRG